VKKLIIGGAVALGLGAIICYFMNRDKSLGSCRGCRGLSGYGEASGAATGVVGLPESKVRAQEWLAAQLAYQNVDKVEHEVVNYTSSMAEGQEEAFANVLRQKFDRPVTLENFHWAGIGRAGY
jgi:hypothetical protein